jgi:hypothetical protein
MGSESETCVGSRVHLVGASISIEKNSYRLPFTPPSLVRRIGPSSGIRAVSVLHPQWSMLSNQRHKVYPCSGRAGRTSSTGVLRALYCSAPGVPVVGRLQARRERRRGLQVPGEVDEDVVGELRNVCVVCRELFVAWVSPLPCGGGVHLPFIGQGEDELHARRTIQLHGEVWCVAP